VNRKEGYFITGGAGFIGSHLVDKLVRMGKVLVYDNLSSGKKGFIKHQLDKMDFQFIQADLMEFNTVERAMKDYNFIFHMAANPDVKAGIEDTSLDLNQGTVTTYHVLEAMRTNGIRKIVIASSSAIYGETSMEPIPEDYGPLKPISLYGASKLASEGLVTAFCHLFDIQAWIFRLANVVGPRATHGVVFDFINKLRQNPKELEILGSGTQEKSYLHIEDCVEGILWGIQHSNDRVNILNIGESSTTSVNKIAEILIQEMDLANVKLKYTGGDRGWPGDVPKVRMDTLRMKRLGWKPNFTSDEAIRRAIRNILAKSH